MPYSVHQQPAAVHRATEVGREAIDTMAALLVAACFLLILIARSRLVRHTRRQLLVNFLVALAASGFSLAQRCWSIGRQIPSRCSRCHTVPSWTIGRWPKLFSEPPQSSL